MGYNKLKAAGYRCRNQKLWVFISLFLILCVSLSLRATSVSADEIKSRAAVVMDAATGRVLYAKNPDLRLMPASTTKLMTALVTIDSRELDDVVTVSRKAEHTPASKIGLKTRDSVTIGTLLYAALMKSANDAAVAIAEAVAGTEKKFVSLMNKKASAIGLKNTRFVNSNGLPGKGQYTTAYDLAKIMRQSIGRPVLKEILGTRVTEVSTKEGKTIFMKNTNQLLWSDEDFVRGKTGYTRQAKHCFVGVSESESGTIIVAILGTPSRSLLWKETEDLIAMGTRFLRNSEKAVGYLPESEFDGSKIMKASFTEQPVTPSIKKIKFD